MLKPLNLFLSFFWKHLYTSKKSQPIDTVLIFTSPKWSFSVPTQGAKRDPRKPACHDSTAVYLIAWGRDDLCPLTDPEGLVCSLKCLKCCVWSLHLRPPGPYLTHKYKHTDWQGFPPAEATLCLQENLKASNCWLMVNPSSGWICVDSSLEVPPVSRGHSIPPPLASHIHSRERVENDSVYLPLWIIHFFSSVI